MMDEVTSDERRIIRDLASVVAEISTDPVQGRRREIWYAQNALRPLRPPVFISPDGSWAELIPARSLACESEDARAIEMDLRKRIYAHERFGDDQVVDAQWRVPYAVRRTGWGIGADIQRPDADRGAHTWKAPVTCAADLDRIKTPTAEHDAAESERRLAWHQELFGDTLNVQLHGNWWWSLGLIDEWTHLRGLTQTYLDMSDDPELLREGMRRLMEGKLAFVERLEELGVLSLNNGNDYIGSGCFGFSHELPQDDFVGAARLRDMWGFAEAQPMSSVSPEMHEEFVLPYQLPILQRFALNCYGCCEPLDRHLSFLLTQVPRLRRVSISPWADIRRSAEQLGDGVIFSWKLNPARLAGVSFDEDALRAEMRNTLQIAADHGCAIEIVVRTTHTCNNQPQRFDSCARIAMSEALRIVS